MGFVLHPPASLFHHEDEERSWHSLSVVIFSHGVMPKKDM